MRQVRSRFALIAALCAVAGLAVHGVAAPSSAVPRSPDDATIVHVLNRLGFGPRPGDVERVRSMGLASWIDRQLQPGRVADDAVDARLGGLPTLRMTSTQIAEEYLQPLLEQRRQRRRDAVPEADMDPRRERAAEIGPALRRQQELLRELVAQKMLRAVYSERQLQEVLTDFWFNHFNVFANKGFTRIYLTAYERDAIRPHVLGRFRDLLGATAKSPAMLVYLDNARSADPAFAAKARTDLDRLERAGRRRGTRQAGREITPEMLEQVRQNIPTGINENYARELLELHTLGVDGGFTQQDVVNVARALTGWTIGRPRSAQAGQFWFNPRMHDTGDKVVLGQKIKGGGIEEGERVLDLLARHPSTARFIATKLARRFVADEPPAALVEKATAGFRATDGDLREVVRVIVTSPEFFAAESRRAKIKNPFEFVISALRATGADVADTQPLARALQLQGMPLYLCQPPTGYKETADAWVTSGALVNRMNFAVELASDGARGSVDTLLDGEASEATRETIGKATTPAQAVALALGSPEFQRR